MMPVHVPTTGLLRSGWRCQLCEARNFGPRCGICYANPAGNDGQVPRWVRDGTDPFTAEQLLKASDALQAQNRKV